MRMFMWMVVVALSTALSTGCKEEEANTLAHGGPMGVPQQPADPAPGHFSPRFSVDGN